jgi:hypothetical protein
MAEATGTKVILLDIGRFIPEILLGFSFLFAYENVNLNPVPWRRSLDFPVLATTGRYVFGVTCGCNVNKADISGDRQRELCVQSRSSKMFW